MRKYLRSIARAKMEREGVKHINKPRRDIRGHKTDSYFAENWREGVKHINKPRRDIRGHKTDSYFAENWRKGLPTATKHYIHV